ncbi:acyl-CoA N-acyltransferase [Exidia glandulosa HHB12029]|uniref:Acyl-CoA N-acyltransferase n=1 Tax=Exidia glandulosa HHB12029 TaxID=1314781 RepID=A0A165BAW0_EXIGL|nr:acyl-CoA N-acyltransferase [Exidia glandulosa HHB12029]
MSASQAFVFPLKEFSNDRVRLELFDQLLPRHIALVDEIVAHPDLIRYMPSTPWTSRAHFYSWYSEAQIDSTPSTTVFAIFDRVTSEPAGFIALLNTSSEHETAEIGFLLILPRWQRTHVTTNAAGLLVEYCMRDLKLRRLWWQANAVNVGSLRVAERLGMKLEGIQRWQQVLPEGKEGPRRGEEEKIGRHTAILAICWDDWEKEEVRDALQRQMQHVS